MTCECVAPSSLARLAWNITNNVLPNHARKTERVIATRLSRPQPALVVWHHGTMAKLVSHFPIVNSGEIPKHWPDERFDLIWVLVRQPGAEPKYRFVVVPQMLLADDEEAV